MVVKAYCTVRHAAWKTTTLRHAPEQNSKVHVHVGLQLHDDAGGNGMNVSCRYTDRMNSMLLGMCRLPAEHPLKAACIQVHRGSYHDRWHALQSSISICVCACVCLQANSAALYHRTSHGYM
jgi:hypothetical protein